MCIYQTNTEHDTISIFWNDSDQKHAFQCTNKKEKQKILQIQLSFTLNWDLKITQATMHKWISKV